MNEYSEKIAKAFSSLNFDAINKALDNLSKIGENLFEAYTKIDDWWEKTSPQIIDTYEKLKTPEYSEERKRELAKNYVQWGKYGWTFNNKTRLKTYSSFPASLEAADKVMGVCCTIENVVDMKNKLIQNGINEMDLNEAVFCFENKKYKSCALILFGLIDHELISKGFRKKPRKKQSEGYLKTGEKAVSAYKDENKEAYENSFIYAYLYFLNIMETVSTMFKNTEDFTSEEIIINRHYISHGMSKRNVSDIDCFKVWSALHSLVIMLPVLEDIKVE